MKKLLILCLILSGVYSDTSKEKMDKLSSETTCKTLFRAVMPMGTENLLYKADIQNKIVEKNNMYILMTKIPYGKNDSFFCVSVKSNFKLKLYEFGIYKNDMTPIKIYNFEDMIKGNY